LPMNCRCAFYRAPVSLIIVKILNFTIIDQTGKRRRVMRFSSVGQSAKPHNNLQPNETVDQRPCALAPKQ
jgi:hypothetical protein